MWSEDAVKLGQCAVPDIVDQEIVSVGTLRKVLLCVVHDEVGAKGSD